MQLSTKVRCMQSHLREAIFMCWTYGILVAIEHFYYCAKIHLLTIKPNDRMYSSLSTVVIIHNQNVVADSPYSL